MGCNTWFFRPIKEGEIPSDTCEYSYKIFGEDKYTDIDTPHDVFRFSTQEDIYLLSLEQTLNFLEDNEDKIDFYGDKSYVIKKITQFWKEFPDGVIEFG